MPQAEASKPKGRSLRWVEPGAAKVLRRAGLVEEPEVGGAWSSQKTKVGGAWDIQSSEAGGSRRRSLRWVEPRTTGGLRRNLKWVEPKVGGALKLRVAEEIGATE